MKLTPTFQMTLCLVVGGLLGGANPGSAQVTQQLFVQPTASPTADSYSGCLGEKFVVGSTNVVVSHVGVYGPSGLSASHQAGILDSSGTVLLGGVTLPAGTSAYLTNSYRWMPLDPPLMLSAGGTYIVACMTVSGDGDQYWNQGTPQSWNPWFIGSQSSSTTHAMYGPGSSSQWPPPYMSQASANRIYGADLAYIEIDQARVGVQTTSVSIGAGQTLIVIGFATGQQPITNQWWQAPNTPLGTQTNATLVISNIAAGSYTYYLTGTNALGGEQSASVNVTVSSYPVGITQQPASTTNFAYYPVSFSLSVTGTPPISFEWLRNSAAIPGATQSSYSFTASLTNNGDVYACVVSNLSGQYYATSSNATLTVVANQALPQTLLHGARAAATNNFSGTVGGLFTVGNTPALVTHLGYYASQFTDAYKTNATLSVDHHVGVFGADGSTLCASVVVSAGTHPVVNGYMWTALATPMVLTNNTRYLLVAEVSSGQDPWGDTYAIPDGNPYYVTANSTFAATYWGAAWPATGTAGQLSGQMYSAPNLAVLAPATPVAWAQPTTVTQYVGLNVTFSGAVAGQPPVLAQWYKEPGALLNGQTNLSLNLNSLSLGDAGGYFLLATNPVNLTSGLSSDATVTVLPDAGPSIDQDIQSQTVFLYQPASFAPAVSGTPPLSYQWLFNGSPISGATNAALALTGVSAADVGTYQLVVTNAYGTNSTSAATLSVTVPSWGTYPSAVMGSGLIAYYPLNDAASSTATNRGSLGLAYNGTYEGPYGYGTSYSSVPGPTNILESPADAANAVALDGFSADVSVPSLPVTLTNCTIAAWVMDAGDQSDNNAIFYHRQSAVFGLTIGVGQVGTGGEWVKYTWNNSFYNNDTALTLPTNQWAFVAMVINPTNATIYMQDGTGMRSINFAGTYPPQSFSGVSYIGYDTAGGSTGRRWMGDLADVMMFNQALSPVAVNALYLGVPASATLTIAPAAGGQLEVRWPGGTLEEATNLLGSWSATANATNGVYTLTPSAPEKFYRVRLQ